MATSLEILRPSPSPPINERNPEGPLARYLEKKSSKLVGLIARREWRHPDVEQCLDPYWLRQLSGKTSSRGQHVCNDRSITMANTAELDVVGMSTEVKEKEGRASVWMLLALPNDDTGSVQESVVVLQWKTDGGRWMCYEQNSLRGGSGFGI